MFAHVSTQRNQSAHAWECHGKCHEIHWKIQSLNHHLFTAMFWTHQTLLDLSHLNLPKRPAKVFHRPALAALASWQPEFPNIEKQRHKSINKQDQTKAMFSKRALPISQTEVPWNLETCYLWKQKPWKWPCRLPVACAIRTAATFFQPPSGASGTGQAKAVIIECTVFVSK